MHIASLPTRMNMASIPIIKKDMRSYQKTIPSLQEGIYLTRIIRLDQKNANLSLKTWNMKKYGHKEFKLKLNKTWFSKENRVTDPAESFGYIKWYSC